MPLVSTLIVVMTLFFWVGWFVSFDSEKIDEQNRNYADQTLLAVVDRIPFACIKAAFTVLQLGLYSWLAEEKIKLFSFAVFHYSGSRSSYDSHRNQPIQILVFFGMSVKDNWLSIFGQGKGTKPCLTAWALGNGREDNAHKMTALCKRSKSQNNLLHWCLYSKVETYHHLSEHSRIRMAASVATVCATAAAATQYLNNGPPHLVPPKHFMARNRHSCSSYANPHMKPRNTTTKSSLLLQKWCLRAAAPASITPTTSNGRNASKNGTAIVWFKHDLRTDDHPGLCQAALYENVVPVYVFEPRIYSRFSKEMLGILIDAVMNLKQELRNLGSDLIIRCGCARDILVELLREVNAQLIITEAETEYEWQKIVNLVSDSLSTFTVSGEMPYVSFWQAHLFEFKALEQVPVSFKDFQKLRLPLVCPVSCPDLPGLQLDMERGEIPDTNALRDICSEAVTQNFDDDWFSIKFASLNGVLNGRQHEQDEKTAVASEGNIQRIAMLGGTKDIRNALDGYLRYLEATWREDYQEVHGRVRLSESRGGASFRAIFGHALSLGIISSRTVYDEAIKYEKERNAGWINPFGYSAFTISAAVEDSLCVEWYRILSLKSQQQGMIEGLPVKTWMWRGYLVQYTTGGNEGPPILLVHGFGAFWEHYRDNINCLSKSGHKVYALTLIGFGRSEKPNIIYSESTWAELLRDFIVDIIGEPTHIVGNSFGGYLVSMVAGFWPELTKSLILCNPGGKVIPKYSNVKYLKPDPNSSISQYGARFLLFYLRLMAEGILKRFYPVNPKRANRTLLEEILRSSYDPNTLAVLESIVSLKLSVPLNYLLASCNKEVLLIQGNKDPLFQSRSTARMLKQEYPKITIKEVNAGHCPHDEIPTEVNKIIVDWLKQFETIVDSESSSLKAMLT